MLRRWFPLLALTFGCHALLPLESPSDGATDLPGDITSDLDAAMDHPVGDGPQDLSWDRSDGPGSPDVLPDQHNPPDISGDGPGPCDPNQIGVPCDSTGGPQCGGKAFCVLYQDPKGVCGCPCTPDSPQTPLTNEDSCLKLPVAGLVCVPGPISGHFCARKCNPRLGANDCIAPLACQPGTMAYSGTKDHGVCLFRGCKSGTFDCPVFTNQLCTALAACTASGQSCIEDPFNGVSRCATQGPCDTASGICAPRSSGGPGKIGDPCKKDGDCPKNGFCLMEYDQVAGGKKKGGAQCTNDTDCCSRSCENSICKPGLCLTRYRNGYCASGGCAFDTLLEAKCDAGATCSFRHASMGGMCLKYCNLNNTASCRGNPNDLYGDYECRAWNNLVYDDQQAAAMPVCEWGPSLPCSTFSQTTLDCTSLGSQANPTKMFCRTLDAQQTTTYYAHGFCLDVTASGGGVRKPTPTP